MRILLLSFFVLVFGHLATAQAMNNGEILFETDFRDSDLEAPIPAGWDIVGINLRILSTAQANSMGLNIGDPLVFPSIAMDPPPGGRTEGFYTYDDNAYTTIFQPNGSTGSIEIRWYFEAVISDGTTMDTIRENLADDVVGAGELDITGCQVFPQAGTQVRRYFMNGNQNRALRAKLGSCYLVGDQELVLTIDSRSAAISPVNNMAFVPAMGRMMAWNAFPNFNLSNNGDGTFTGRFAMGPNEFLVYSYSLNFGSNESGTMNGQVPVTACGVFNFGSRSYFQVAGAPNVEVNTDLWSSYTPDVGGTIIEPFAANSTVTANASVTLADGFTYYLNGTRKLIAINWGTETPAAPADVSVSFGASQATFYNDGEGFIANGEGAAIMGRTWNVANTTISSDVDVRFYFTQADIDAINALVASPVTADQLQFFKTIDDTADETDFPSLTIDDVIVYSEGAAAPGTEASTFDLDDECTPLNSVTFTVNSFSGGGGGGVTMGGNFLPVEFSALSAESVKQNVMVKWSTASESGNVGFEVQHSTSGLLFQPLGMVSAAPDGQNGSNYSFEHQQAPLGRNFYRLKQMDLDGGFSYSEVVTTVVEASGEPLSVYPNPADDAIFVSAKERGQLAIRDAQGQIINQINATGDPQRIDLSRLNAGLYFITLNNGSTVTSQRFIKR
ncbi:MAG: T9SS type A sorting domain-containing protein [Bacteroidota bacterium]